MHRSDIEQFQNRTFLFFRLNTDHIKLTGTYIAEMVEYCNNRLFFVIAYYFFLLPLTRDNHSSRPEPQCLSAGLCFLFNTTKFYEWR